MAKILSFRSKYDSLVEIKDNIFQKIWDWFNSLDRFAKTSLITMILIIVIGVASVGVYFDLRGHAAQNISNAPIDDFELDTTTVNGWYTGSWPATNSGQMTLVTPGYNSNHAAGLTFNFSSSSTGPQETSLNYTFPSVQPQAAELGFWVKSPAGVHIILYVIDSAGQRLDYHTERPFEATDPNAWYQQVVKLDEPTHQIAYVQGGATDGVVHYPIKSIGIAVAAVLGNYYLSSNNAILNGQVSIDNVQWLDVGATNITRNIDPTDPAIVMPPTANANLLNTLSEGIHTIDPTTVTELQQLGVKIVRSDLAWWDTIETSPGVYNWSAYDQYVSQLQQAGIKVLYILDYGNHLYMTLKDASGNSYGPATPGAITGFANFASAAASHFNAKFPGQVMLEVWNEPHVQNFWAQGPNAAQYAALESAAVTKIQSVNPTMFITTAGFAGDYNYLHSYLSSLQSLATNPGEHANAIALHPYRQDIPETISDDIAYIRSVAPVGVQTWITEWGYPNDNGWWGITSNTNDRYLLSQGSNLSTLQAKMVARQLWTSFALGLQHMDSYDIQDYANTGDYFGLLDASNNPKPAWNAFTTVTKFASQFQFVGIEPMQLTNMHTLVLKNSSQYLLVMWKDELSAPVAANISSAFPIQSVTDYMNNPVSFANNQVLVNDTPVYVVLGIPGVPTPTPTPTQTPIITSPTPTFTPTPTLGVTDTTPPTVAITSPVSGVTVARRSTTTITANASDNVGVAQVQIFVNGTVICTDTTSPYSCNFSVPGKPGASYTITAIAYDAAGNHTTSAPVIVTAK